MKVSLYFPRKKRELVNTSRATYYRKKMGSMSDVQVYKIEIYNAKWSVAKFIDDKKTRKHGKPLKFKKYNGPRRVISEFLQFTFFRVTISTRDNSLKEETMALSTKRAALFLGYIPVL